MTLAAKSIDLLREGGLEFRSYRRSDGVRHHALWWDKARRRLCSAATAWSGPVLSGRLHQPQQRVEESLGLSEYLKGTSIQIPRCINTVFDGLDSGSRKNLAREMMNRMMSIFKEELDTEGQ